MSAPDLSVVVPVFNNAGTRDELLDRLHAALDAGLSPAERPP